MSSNSVYISDNYSEPMTPQHNFSNNFDLDNPTQAMSSYARIMHEHTKRQLSSATSSARRRSQNTPGSPSISLSSVSSTSP
ncbi:hypothetical protein P280DRAFT_464769 [Massarina eburnea CBS 473.64]|uniref:Uncharacterized protein n=1 Tax=Massarina eburnea CBS 473.64 TaxID=1395130 RepID=A0A6A6SGX0_9PLEO|nr:hypothetical protein P280DRAFT_464769 [Massarina eburnea CBS 473.64]